MGFFSGPSVFFNIFIRDLDKEIKGMVSKSADETRFEDMLMSSEDTVTVQKILCRYAHWAFFQQNAA